MYTISHPYAFPIKIADFDQRDHKKAVIVTRLDPIKRLPDAVEIFGMVLKEVPDATMDIYGFGQDEQRIKGKIAELSIGDNVKLAGYTDKASEVISGASCFLLTSGAEGLPLTLLESVSNGCPVFAYDIKYGPAYAVKNKVTGYLFKPGDMKSFAKAMVRYFKDIESQKRMSRNCYDDAPRFSVDVFLNKWLSLINDMYKKMNRSIGG